MRRGLLLALAVLMPGPLVAQARSVRVTGGWRVAVEHARRPLTDSTRYLVEGFVLGGEATATRGRLLLRARYGQGNLNHDSVDSLFRRFTDGELLVGVRAAPWLALWVGPHARSYTDERDRTGETDRTERWLFWEARAHARGTVVPDMLTSFLEIWGAFNGSVTNLDPRFGSAGGAEGGLEFRMRGRSLTWRLSYRIEQARLVSGDHRETAEGLALGILLNILD